MTRVGRLAAFLPPPIARLAARLEPGGSPGRCERLRGSALVIDIAGFTPFAEAHSALGRPGIEALHVALQREFASITAAIEEQGGFVGRFLGDAVLAFFPGDPGAAAAAGARRVLDERRARGPLRTIAGRFPLSLRAGVASGELEATIVGDPLSRLDFVLGGSAVAAAAAAQTRARPGRVVLATDGMAAAPSEPARRYVSRVPDARVRPFLHPALAERIAAGLDAFVFEHRVVSVAFLSLGEVADANIVPHSRAVARAIVDAGGHVHQFEVGDKGALAIAVFGAPTVGEDDPRAALACANALVRDGAVQRAGVARGSVFCGVLGSRDRREYTLVGSTLTVAARLMGAAAPGGCLATRDALVAAGEGAPRRRITLKGIDERVAAGAIPTRAPHAAGDEATAPLLGRVSELAGLSRSLHAARAGAGSAVLIYGVAGIGKSRVVSSVVRDARNLGFVVAVLQGAPASSAYAALVPALRTLLPEDGWRGLDARFADRAPLLGPLCGERVRDTPALSQLAPVDRAEALEQLLVGVVLAAAARAPTLLVAEDAHWIDSASRGVLEAIAGHAASVPLLLLASSRSSRGVLAEARRLRLAPLSRTTLRRLIEPRVDDRATADRIAAQANGNPFLAVELAATADDGTLPATIDEAVLRRVDRLDEHAKATLKAASIVGATLDPRLLRLVAPRLRPPDTLAATLDRLVTAGELTRDEGSLRFRHALVNDALYRSLPADEVVQRHGELAASLLGRRGADAEQALHHARRSGQEGHVIVALDKAGQSSRAAYDLTTAASHLEELLSIEPPGERGGTLLLLGEVRELSGDWPRAARAFRKAIRVSARGGRDEALARAQLGRVLGAAHGFPTARLHLRRAVSQLDALGEDDALAEALSTLAQTAIMGGELAEAQAAIERLLRLPRVERSTRMVALGLLGTVYLMTDRGADALRPLKRAVAFAERANDLLYVAGFSADLAGAYWSTGDAASAMHALARALAASSRGSLPALERVALANAAEIASVRGERHAALRYAQAAIERSETAHDLRALAHVAHALGQVLMWTDRALAERALSASLLAARTLGDAEEAAPVQLDRAVLALEQSHRRGTAPARGPARLLREAALVDRDCELTLRRFALRGAALEQRHALARELERMHARSPKLRYRAEARMVDGRVLAPPAPLPPLGISLPRPLSAARVVDLAERAVASARRR